MNHPPAATSINVSPRRGHRSLVADPRTTHLVTGTAAKDGAKPSDLEQCPRKVRSNRDIMVVISVAMAS
ncbi:hypothetical protein PLICRDRAFT_49979 [Plicaturopsis crispa FD-325 SS-3]|nr:hypothetical protein PLICRDRAFT_49979 [Plicaturopsis crispa FD-325 SS-3]